MWAIVYNTGMSHQGYMGFYCKTVKKITLKQKKNIFTILAIQYISILASHDKCFISLDTHK